jgi:hypothetical protein
VSSQHTDVAAYSLGLLEPADREDFEAHVAQCESCTAELAEFAAVADLFAGVEPVETGPVEPTDAALGDFMRRRAAAGRRRIRWQAVLAAAACLVLLAGGAAVGIAAGPNHRAASGQIVLSGQRHSATDARTGASGTVGLVAKPWGTQVSMDLSGLRGPLDCELIAVSSAGERRVIAGWFVPPSGYGVPGHPGHLLLTGGTAIPETDLSRVEVDVVHGATLLRIST